MAKQASKTLIGAFVLGAVVLIVSGLMVFGSGRFFTKTYAYVMYFEGSVKGLTVGAPVVFRGVKIGSVTDIVLLTDLKDMTVQIPVYIEVIPEEVSNLINIRSFSIDQNRLNETEIDKIEKIFEGKYLQTYNQFGYEHQNFHDK